MHKYRTILLLFVIACIFFVKALIFLDPDFGWHYQMGKIISERGVPKLDQFSYTMSNFEYIDHEWLTDVLIYKTYNSVGIFGLSLTWCLIVVLTFGVAVDISEHLKNFKYKNLVIYITLIVISSLLLPQFGIRPQVISWLFFTLLLWLLNYWENIGKLKYITPILFLLWANMHGAYFLGLVVFAINLIIKFFKVKKVKFEDFLILLLSLLSTLVNPYFIKLWGEIFNTFFSSSLRGQIEEWKPFWTGVNITYPFVVILTSVFIYYFRKKYKTEKQLTFIVLLIMSFSALINLPFFAIYATPVLIEGFVFLEKKSKLYKFGSIRYKKLLFSLAILLTLYSFINYFYSIKSGYKYSENKFYPLEAVNYISQNLPNGEIFSSYNWGGYLIWKLPQKKVFIDGRMAHWPNILNLHNQVITGDLDYIEIFNKYNIRMVLLPNTERELVFINKIKGDGWIEIFNDNKSIILINK